MDHNGEIHEALLDDVREAVVGMAAELVAACLEAIEEVGFPGNLLRSLAAVASVAGERARFGDPLDLATAASLCARVIEASSADLDRLSDQQPGGLAVANAACRCADACQQALLVLYETS